MASARWMNGGRVTSTSACGFDFSFATRSTTPPEPPSTYWTLIAGRLGEGVELGFEPAALAVVQAVGGIDGDDVGGREGRRRETRRATSNALRRDFMGASSLLLLSNHR